ncbi:hypothetical protein AB0J57_30250 [Streptomyces sp. NPDC049837]|uniref:hypothetical protein n=1 Tax=Streptomyces sp. NPDC049837 TaxID=3155277 RepID=UPI00341435FF
MPPNPSPVLENQERESFITYTAAPHDPDVLRELHKYQISEITETWEEEDYRDFLKKALTPLGLFREEFLPSQSSHCYRITFDGETTAIFRLTPTDPGSVFHQVIPGAAGKKILEVNNVAVEESFRGDLLLGVILRDCALLAHEKGYDFVAGVVRHEILPLFVDFGTIPVRHDPLHILGDENICDYVTYFMTHRREHIDYACARGYHYFHRKVTMNAIDADVRRSRERAGR